MRLKHFNTIQGIRECLYTESCLPKMQLFTLKISLIFDVSLLLFMFKYLQIRVHYDCYLIINQIFLKMMIKQTES